jgi:hypothetical protein
MNEKMLALMASADEEIKQAKLAVKAARKAIWEAKCKIEKADAKKASLLHQASLLKPKPPSDGFDYNQPVLLLISSRDMKRERLLGSFASRAWAIHEARRRQALGMQAGGCVFFVRDLRLKKDETCDIVIRKKTPFMEQYPGLAKKAYSHAAVQRPAAGTEGY